MEKLAMKVNNSKKKILIITYYWPPSGGSGVQRWVKFVKYLVKKGWEPIIYTPENPEYPSIDESMLKDVPANLEVLKTKIWEPFDFYRKFTGKKKNEKINAGFLNEGKKKNGLTQNLSVWIRGNFFIPDARKFWIKPSIKFLNKYLENNEIDYMVSTGPPHSTHLIARGIKKKNNIPWIADFRDPWTNIDFYKDLKLTKLADKKHHRLECAVLKEADLTITIGETMKTEFEALGAKKVICIPNGFDKEDLSAKSIEKDEKFSIAHIGTLNPSRNPQLLWESLSELVSENQIFASRLSIKLVGKVDFIVKEAIKKAGLSQYLELIPYLPHDEAIDEQQRSHVLLLLVNNTPNAKGILTGKIFEYMSSRTPIIGIGPVDGDAANILNQTKSGIMVDYEDKEGLKDGLKLMFNNGFSTETADINSYSRESLTERLVSALGEL